MAVELPKSQNGVELTRSSETGFYFINWSNLADLIRHETLADSIRPPQNFGGAHWTIDIRNAKGPIRAR